MVSHKDVRKILDSRSVLRPPQRDGSTDEGRVAEGGCGVIGMASSERIAGRHLLQALDQMRNRGNGKGGGIAAAGLVAEQFGVSQKILDKDYLLAIAYLDADCRHDVEQKHILPTFNVDNVREAPHMGDHQAIKDLEVKPPEVWQYFVRPKPAIVEDFRREHDLALPQRQVEDELVYQNSVRLNTEFYASTGDKRAFVLSHGKNLLVMKMVGYGDDVIRYYQLEDMRAHVWIGHHRYPTKGRVWHPGGAHPFVGLNEALVHNGDFANYASIGEYLAQRNIYPLYLTDTEVSVQVFDLLSRTYNYPLEYVIEALAPTTERDFVKLPGEKQHIYQMLQTTHIHSSPDGPWFFLIAQSNEEDGRPVYRLTGITDTSMLRPQVFAWQESGPGGPAIGLAASEKQGIDAALASLAAEDKRFWSQADRYWNARGGSHTDGGAFVFTARPNRNGSAMLSCSDKFGRPVEVDTSRQPFQEKIYIPAPKSAPAVPADELYQWVIERLPGWTYEDVLDLLCTLEEEALRDEGWARSTAVITLMMDRRYPTGELRRSSLLALLNESFNRMVGSLTHRSSNDYVFFNAGRITQYIARPCQTAVVDAQEFEPEGPESLSAAVVHLRQNGFNKFVIARAGGHRFIGNGLGPGVSDVHIDVYGSSGDYLASGIDGVEIQVHGSGQDQLAQIMKSGKLVVHGDVGQTFMYGAKGGEAYVLGNAAGRPLINAVGKPRVVINGTCLDYLAESFMAGDPHAGGGFVVVNGIALSDDGEIVELDTPYPGGNLFSLASGGAIFIRDPHRRLSEDQLNGGEFRPFEPRDWSLILPYLQENERQFGISVEKLLEVEGQGKNPAAVYRKIEPAEARALQAEEAWVAKH